VTRAVRKVNLRSLAPLRTDPAQRVDVAMLYIVCIVGWMPRIRALAKKWLVSDPTCGATEARRLHSQPPSRPRRSAWPVSLLPSLHCYISHRSLNMPYKFETKVRCLWLAFAALCVLRRPLGSLRHRAASSPC